MACCGEIVAGLLVVCFDVELLLACFWWASALSLLLPCLWWASRVVSLDDEFHVIG
jgi:hypothetical protein